MSIQEVAPEQLAELFHHYHQALAPDVQCAKKASETWDHVPQPEKSRLVAAARLTLLELAATAQEREDSRRYFAKPGNAEWGCWVNSSAAAASSCPICPTEVCCVAYVLVVDRIVDQSGIERSSPLWIPKFTFMNSLRTP